MIFARVFSYIVYKINYYNLQLHHGTVKSVILGISIALAAAMSCLLILFCVMQLCSRYQRSRRRPLSPNQDQGLAGNSNVQIIGDQSPPNYVTVVLDEDSLPTYEEAENRSKELHSGPEDLNSRQKLVKSNFFFREIAFLAVLNFFPVQKLICGHF